MAFFAVFGLILFLGFLRKRPGLGSYLLIAISAGVATAWEVIKS